MEFRDYYETLGVTRTASAEEIRSAFRKKAREYHPDVAKDKAKGAERFKEVNEAYEVLSDPAKRMKYDQMGREGPGGGFAWQGAPGPSGPDMEEFHFGGTGYSDFFEHLFGGMGGGGVRGPGGRRMARRGSDIEGDLMVPLEEALGGSVREVTLQRGGKTAAAGREDRNLPGEDSRGCAGGTEDPVGGQGGVGAKWRGIRGSLPAGETRAASRPEGGGQGSLH